MYYPLSSYSILFFLFSLFYHLPCASSKQGLGWCESLFQCGNITADFPFWGGSRHKPCGHPLLELHCNNNNITSLFISNQEFYVRQLNQTSNILTLARSDLLGSFCSSSAYNTTTLPPEIFELPPTYKSLTVLYHCDPKLSYRSSYTCPALGTFSVSQSLEYQYSCQKNFSVNVPTSFNPEERGLNLTNLESVLRKGFDVKLAIDEIPCQECLSTRGICGFNSTTQICCNVTSPSGGVTCVPQHQPSELGCDEGRSYYVTRNLSSPLLDTSRGLLNNFREMCKRNVSVPASGQALYDLQKSPNPDNLKMALEQGFTLEVNSDCRRCLHSYDTCGYNQTSSEFVCYCKDGKCRNDDEGFFRRHQGAINDGNIL
ncbi:predicted protein [Arabidopsis lyrata subsp. lyrata]|uniref:non-specific serine/threonine protein kinase n=1 Tax=Arabidopsis lyrata subsp. lyrata TaxID=81972 RepID=D7KUX7_ARALL|nr:predicted protein [Arabidopsis lyrata subsp. lyrata]